MSLSIIVAVSQNGVIGKEGGLPWHLPSELARFKAITLGHPIIMGRKTHESIGRALPDRKNIVITHDKSYKSEGCLVVNSLQEAIAATDSADEAFVIGGSAIYDQVLPQIDKIYLTRVKADIKGDKFFRFDLSLWQQIAAEQHPADDKNKYAFEFQEWVRK
jgi:dihydrofolate reductase